MLQQRAQCPSVLLLLLAVWQQPQQQAGVDTHSLALRLSLLALGPEHVRKVDEKGASKAAGGGGCQMRHLLSAAVVSRSATTLSSSLTLKPEP